MQVFRPVIFFVMAFLPARVFASVAGEVNKANDLYKQHKFDDSLKLYQEALDQDENSPAVNYDIGTALYKKGDYAKALGYLEQAAQDKNIKIKPKAEYNLGNVLYKSGMQKANTNVDGAIKDLREALGHYGQALGVDPKDQDAILNEDFIKKQIERLKQIKQQQQQQQQNQQQNQNQKQKQNQKQNQQQDQNQKQQQQSQQNQQNQQGQQNQKDQQGQQAQQNQQEQQKQNEKQQQASQSQAQKQKNAGPQAQESQKELDRKQAEDLLEEYQDNEEPKKLLNYMPQKIDDRPVLKDW